MEYCVDGFTILSCQMRIDGFCCFQDSNAGSSVSALFALSLQLLLADCEHIDTAVM